MNGHDFADRVKGLSFIDMPDLVAAGIIPKGDYIKFMTFTDDPVDFLIRADDSVKEKIWGILELRGGKLSDAPKPPQALSDLIAVVEQYIADLRTFDLTPEQRTNRMAFAQASVEAARRA